MNLFDFGDDSFKELLISKQASLYILTEIFYKQMLKACEMNWSNDHVFLQDEDLMIVSSWQINISWSIDRVILWDERIMITSSWKMNISWWGRGALEMDDYYIIITVTVFYYFMLQCIVKICKICLFEENA